MQEYIRILEKLGLKVIEASVSALMGFWYLKVHDQYGYEYSLVIDPCMGPIVDPEEEVPWEVFDAWELL